MTVAEIRRELAECMDMQRRAEMYEASRQSYHWPRAQRMREELKTRMPAAIAAADRVLAATTLEGVQDA